MTAPRTALELPLDGIRAVEASAGTGKTFTIATLYLRLLLERGLAVDAIVVATFTRAAAAELATRLRERLVLADALLAGASPATPQTSDTGEARACREVFAAALQTGTSLDTLRQRARDARLAIDTACINTLHGFCHRVLAEFGFDTGRALRDPELCDDLSELECEIVRDFWRRGSADAATATLLADGWQSPEALARQLHDPRWQQYAAKVATPDTAALQRELAAARVRIAAWDDAAHAAAATALDACIDHAPTRKLRSAALAAVHAWAQAGGDDLPDADTLKQARSLTAEKLDGLKPVGRHAEGPAFDAIEALCAAVAALEQAQHAEATLPAARLLLAARAYLDAELPVRLAARNRVGHDQAVAQLARALADPAHGASAVARIRARWQAALVDEFQDTDRRQWEVVRALFGATTLVLVGDPKQAIYGFRGGDVYAWLEARAQAADEALRLADSYRSGSGLCAAVNALFSQPDAFIERGITHPDIQAAAPVAARALLQDGAPLAALQLWWVDPETTPHTGDKPPSKAHAQAAIEAACVGWIVRMLDDPKVALRHGDGTLERLLPKHIAVLVDSNDQAAALQAALGRAGVPAASNLRASVYTSDAAGDLALLVTALAAPDDPRRVRAAHASVLIGTDAAILAAGSDAPDADAALLERAAAWAAEVQRHGPLAWLHRLLADAAPRLLALPDGERRVANYLQLAELAQALHAASFGLDDFATRYARARAESDGDADTARLRLDTDANAVTVATVHAAKGLEYDVVLVPYALLGHAPAGRSGAQPPLYWYHAGNDARVAIGGATGAAIAARAALETRAEDVRKLYVAVTRASTLCVVPWGPVASAGHSPLFHLLHGAGRPADARLACDAAGCRQALADVCRRASGAAEVVPLPSPAPAHRAPDTTPPAALQARSFARRDLERDWRTWSFSRLVRGSGPHTTADPAPGNGDGSAATDAADPGFDAELAGARFGTAVHAALERTDFSAWRAAAGVPDSERALIERSLAEQGLAAGAARTRRAVEVVGGCIGGALNAELPCGVRLCDVASNARRAEIEFHLALGNVDTQRLYALLHQHGYQRQRSGVAPARLHGLLTGKIDLTFIHAGQVHLIDWKTNHCPPYDAAALDAEIALHDYDLQWLIYTLALHRWLRQQLPDYRYARDVGDAYYLFVRGMAAGRGIHVDRPPHELVVALDALCGGTA